MSLATDIRAAVDQAWTALDDIPVSVTLVEPQAVTSYSPTTGVVSQTGATSTTVTAIRRQYSRREIDGVAVMPNDQEYLIPASQVAAQPSLQAKITDGSQTWQIIEVQRDPVSAVYRVQARKV